MHADAAFPVVLFGSIGLFIVVGLLSFLTRRNVHDQIGQDGLFMGDDPFGGGASLGGSGGWGLDEAWGTSEIAHSPAGEQTGFQIESRAERELEIRQLLEARSERLVRRGQEPLDIDAELARLAPVGAESGSHDPALTAEVRQLVVARNDRRQRQGLDALDVDAEVARTLAELDP